MKRNIVILLALSLTVALVAPVTVAEHPVSQPVEVPSAVSADWEYPAGEPMAEHPAVEEVLDHPAVEQAAELPAVAADLEQTTGEAATAFPAALPEVKNPATAKPLDHPAH